MKHISEAPAVANHTATTAPKGVRQDQPTSELRLITPEIAKIMLAENTANRPLNERHVKMLSREMETGNWKLNGDTIRFANGRLLDGQHRLEACVRTGVSFPSFVIEGLKHTVFDTIDTGRTRSAADTLALQGEADPKRLAATVRFVGACLNGQMGNNIRLSTTEVESILKDNPAIRESVAFCARNAKILLPFPIMAGCHYLFTLKDLPASAAFIEQLISGNGENKAVHQLRERLLQNTLSKSKLSPKYLAALTIKTWNISREGKVVKNLGWRASGKNPESFPVAA